MKPTATPFVPEMTTVTEAYRKSFETMGELTSRSTSGMQTAFASLSTTANAAELPRNGVMSRNVTPAVG